MVKALDAPYEAGRRGASWLKVKRAHTLDLVVLAAEWGHGRRQGWLSNLHLGARDPATGTSSTSAPSSSSRSRSTACRGARATAAASRSASRA